MDIPLELIILLLFFLLPAISRLFQKKPENEAAPPPDYYGEELGGHERRERPAARQQTGGSEPESLEEALRQIREALGQPSPQAERRPEPAPPVPPRPEPVRSRTEPVRTWPEPAVRRTPEPAPRPSTRPEPMAPARQQRVPAKTRFAKDPVDMSVPLKVEIVAKVPPQHAWLLEALRNPREARKAMKLHEVLDPPPALKRLGLRRPR